MRSSMMARLVVSISFALSFAIVSGCITDGTDVVAPTGSAASAAKKGPGDLPIMSDASIPANVTVYGPAVRLGRGTARTYITADSHGDPASVGIELSEKALDGLPTQDSSYVLFFNPLGLTPYTHVYMDWNPHGHEPAHVYDIPHFDFHFYIQPLADRLAIGPDDTLQFANAPAPEYIPDHYMMIPGGVPQMGAHWVDQLAPEFNGGTFTRTFIWGSYDGEVTFFEPMITLDYLRSHPDESLDLRQPQAFQKDGWYATSYGVTAGEHPGNVRISLDGLVFHQGE